MRLWCSKELSHREGSFEYTHHMFWLKYKKNDFLLHALIWRPVSYEVRGVNFGLNIHLCFFIDMCELYVIA